MGFRFGQRVIAFLAILVVNTTLGCSGGGPSSGKGAQPTEPGKDRPLNADPNPPVQKPFAMVPIDSFLGISADFKAYAMSDAGGVEVIDLERGKNLTSPKWDKD